MKKILLISLTAAGLLTTSCSQDEVVSATGAIAFDNTFVDKTTRADEITTNSLQEFYVYGYFQEGTDAAKRVFNNEKVKKNGDSWTYTNIQYWKNASYSFTAIAPSASNGETGGEHQYWTYTPAEADADKIAGKGSIEFKAANANGNQDLIAATVGNEAGTANRSTAVSLSFNHLLARVKFRFVNSFENTNYNIKVNSLDILSQNSVGTYDTSAKTWTCDANDGTFSLGIINQDHNFKVAANTQTDGTWSKNQKDSDVKFIIPEGSELSVNINAKVVNNNSTEDVINDLTSDGKTYTINFNDENTSLEAGYSYVIVVDFANDAEPIKFTVSEVIPWDAETTIPLGNDDDDEGTPVTIKTDDAKDAGYGDSSTSGYDGDISDMYLLQYVEPLYYAKTYASQDTPTEPYYDYEIHTFFTKGKDSEGNEIYYVTVPALTGFKICLPTPQYVHYGWSNQYQTRTICQWGGAWGTQTFKTGTYFNLTYGLSSTQNVNWVQDSGNYKKLFISKDDDTETPVKVTLAFNPASNRLYILDGQTALSHAEYYPSNTGSEFPEGGYVLEQNENTAQFGKCGGVLHAYTGTIQWVDKSLDNTEQ